MFILTKATRFCGDVPSLCIDLGPLVQRLLMNHLTLETPFDQISYHVQRLMQIIVILQSA
jgi:hypothetical protein